MNGIGLEPLLWRDRAITTAALLIIIALSFIERYGGFQAGIAAPLKLGSEHGLYSVGCCRALMALLFAGGIMYIAWIAALTAFALLEKVIPGQWLSWIAGTGLVAWGACLLA